MFREMRNYFLFVKFTVQWTRGIKCFTKMLSKHFIEIKVKLKWVVPQRWVRREGQQQSRRQSEIGDPQCSAEIDNKAIRWWAGRQCRAAARLVCQWPKSAWIRWTLCSASNRVLLLRRKTRLSVSVAQSVNSVCLSKVPFLTCLIPFFHSFYCLNLDIWLVKSNFKAIKNF